MGDSPRETTELQWCFLLFCCWQWPPRLPLRQMPRLRLTLTFSTEDTTDMASTAMATATPMEATTTERGPLMPSPRPRLMLIPTCCTEDTTDISATDTATATPTGTDTTARGPLMPTPLLLPLLSATPTLFPTLPLPWSPPPSPSPTRPTPPPSRPTLLPPTLLSPSLSEATRPLPVTTVT